jgi:hypothetical protein
MSYRAIKQAVLNRGVAPDTFLDQLIAWGVWGVSGEFRGQTGLALWENRTTLRFKGELALTAIDNDFFPRPSLLWG